MAKKKATRKKTKTRKKVAGKKTTTSRTKASAKKTAAKKKSAQKVSPRKKSKTKKKIKLGRSRIPIDAPLDVVFQHDVQAREAFNYLGIRTMRELMAFDPDELIMRLTSPTKQTVGRIRKSLALHNRCLAGDEQFAADFKERTQ